MGGVRQRTCIASKRSQVRPLVTEVTCQIAQMSLSGRVEVGYHDGVMIGVREQDCGRSGNDLAGRCAGTAVGFLPVSGDPMSKRRFTAVMDAKLSDLASPRSFNRYSYVSNNAVKYLDPTGHSCANPGNGFEDRRCAEIEASILESTVLIQISGYRIFTTAAGNDIVTEERMSSSHATVYDERTQVSFNCDLYQEGVFAPWIT